MSLIELREYQQEALEEVKKGFSKGLNSQLIVLPTGSGKTILMAAIGKHFNKRILLLAHREELIQQAVEKFKLYWPESDIGICKGQRNETSNQIVIASVQSCSRPKRLQKIKENGFDILMIDEAHHASARSYQKIIKELGFQNNKSKLLIGVTATPKRSDNQCIGNTFQSVVYSLSVSTMIKDGYLSKVNGRKILTNFSLKNIRMQNGDFSLGDLAEAINTPERNAFISEKYKTYASDRKGVAFCVDVAHCKDLAASFERIGIPSKAIWGDMPTEERKSILKELKEGKIQVATSCGVLTEGFDEPSISCIAMARPTKSQSLYIQCIGRGLRLWPGKQDCLVLDFTDGGHNLDNVMSLSRTIPEAVEVVEGKQKGFNKKESANLPKICLLEECDKEFDILGYSRFIWIPIGGDEWSLLDDEKKEIIVRPFKNGYIADVLENGSISSIISEPVSLEYCFGICEDYARKNLKVHFSDIESSWLNKKSLATRTQRELLKKNNAYKNGMSKTEAFLEIKKIIALKNKKTRQTSEDPITEKQKFFLDRFGIDTENMSKMQAIKEISKIKQKQQFGYI